MPVEFAVAAYRFGHSIIRPFYVLNRHAASSTSSARPAAATSTAAARSRPTWSSSGRTSFPSTRTSRPGSRARSTRSCRSRSPPSPGPPSRPLTRRSTWPSATRCAASASACRPGSRSPRRCALTALSNATLGLSNDPGWGGEAPLWFYILKEAELPPYNGERLGPVGGRIMAEVLVGLLQRDPNSYLYLDPAWKPAPPIAPTTGQFTFVDLLNYAGAA